MSQLNLKSMAQFLGHLTDPPTGVEFDDVRLTLVDALISAHATGGLDHQRWLTCWEAAVATVRDRLISAAWDSIQAAGKVSKYPARRLEALRPDTEITESLLHRLLVTGIDLERLEQLPFDSSGLRARGAATAMAWEQLLNLARQERFRAQLISSQVQGWQRPWRPLVVTAGALIGLTVIVASWIGGLLPAPDWFVPVTDWFWGLPWL